MVDSDLSATAERKKVEKSPRISHIRPSGSCSILLHAYGQMHAKLFFSHMVAIMIEGPAQCRFDEIARKWLALVEKRRDYLVELHMSGRWSEYYEEQKFKRYMREAADAVEHWAALAPRPQAETKPRPGTPLPTLGRRGVA